MQTTYFRSTKKEYCHITEEYIFITNEKVPTRIPSEHELGEAWSVLSVLNYIFFFLIFAYTALSVNSYGYIFFMHIENYGALLLLLLSLMRLKNGLLGSQTPTISRSKIKAIHFKTPKFSYPRLVIYFEGPENKVLRRIIPVLYKKEAEPVLKNANLI
jgi:hypothetical protein